MCVCVCVCVCVCGYCYNASQECGYFAVNHQINNNDFSCVFAKKTVWSFLKHGLYKGDDVASGNNNLRKRSFCGLM